MASNLAIDPKLLATALRIDGQGTKRARVAAALQQLIRQRRLRGPCRLPLFSLDKDLALENTSLL
jgi:hypothetical protein